MQLECHCSVTYKGKQSKEDRKKNKTNKLLNSRNRSEMARALGTDVGWIKFYASTCHILQEEDEDTS